MLCIWTQKRNIIVVIIIFIVTNALSFRLPTSIVLIRSTRDNQRRAIRCIVRVQSPSADQFNTTNGENIAEDNTSIFSTGMTDRFQYKVC
jgi:hypothetical protein